MADQISVFPTTRALLDPKSNPESEVRVLVIDDDANDFFVINRLLGQAVERQFDVAHIASYDEALSDLKTSKYDAILIDYHIGNRCGMEILKAMDEELDVPCIILTGSSSDEIVSEALDAGAFDFLDKNALTGATLLRSIDFAIKRFGIEKQIRDHQSRLQRACENAEAAHFSKSEFLAFLGSELKTPLSAIIGFSQAMKEGPLAQQVPDTHRTYSETIHASGLHLQDLINDLLDLSETSSDAFDGRERRFKRYRTWILDQQEAKETLRADVASEIRSVRHATG
jgi:signal transduction histidine kinase